MLAKLSLLAIYLSFASALRVTVSTDEPIFPGDTVTLTATSAADDPLLVDVWQNYGGGHRVPLNYDPVSVTGEISVTLSSYAPPFGTCVIDIGDAVTGQIYATSNVIFVHGDEDASSRFVIQRD